MTDIKENEKLVQLSGRILPQKKKFFDEVVKGNTYAEKIDTLLAIYEEQLQTDTMGINPHIQGIKKELEKCMEHISSHLMFIADSCDNYQSPMETNVLSKLNSLSREAEMIDHTIADNEQLNEIIRQKVIENETLVRKLKTQSKMIDGFKIENSSLYKDKATLLEEKAKLLEEIAELKSKL